MAEEEKGAIWELSAAPSRPQIPPNSIQNSKGDAGIPNELAGDAAAATPAAARSSG